MTAVLGAGVPAEPLRFGIPIPQVFLDGQADMQFVCTALQRAEQLGFDSAWVQDQVAGNVPLLESISLSSRWRHLPRK